MAFGSMSPGQSGPMMPPSIGQMGMNLFQSAMKQPGNNAQAPGGLLAAIQAAMSGNPTGGLAKSLFGGMQQPPAPGMPADGRMGGVGAANPQMGLLAKMFPQLGMGNPPSPMPGPAPVSDPGPAAGALTGMW